MGLTFEAAIKELRQLQAVAVDLYGLGTKSVDSIIQKKLNSLSEVRNEDASVWSLKVVELGAQLLKELHLSKSTCDTAVLKDLMDNEIEDMESTGRCYCNLSNIREARPPPMELESAVRDGIRICDENRTSSYPYLAWCVQCKLHHLKRSRAFTELGNVATVFYKDRTFYAIDAKAKGTLLTLRTAKGAEYFIESLKENGGCEMVETSSDSIGTLLKQEYEMRKGKPAPVE